MINRHLHALILFVLTLASFNAAAAQDNKPVQADTAKPPVLVELFTSQGCPNCPKANAFLEELAADNNVVALSFAVDYWDYLGWQDTFATPAFTKRQYDYGKTLGKSRIYTPQMVINGSQQYKGFKKTAINAAIEAELKAVRSAPVISAKLDAHGDMVLNVEGDIADNTELWMVSYTPGVQIVKVQSGQNKGKDVAQVNMVSGFSKLTKWTKDEAGGGIHMTMPMPAEGGCAILLQEVGGGKIISAVKLET